jgi:hypothetical protein
MRKARRTNVKRPSVSKHGRKVMSLVAAVAIASLAFAGSASASPPTPPFKQCPTVGFDTSCQILLVVNAHGGLESYVDPSQGPFEGKEDYLIGLQNNSASTVSSVPLKGLDLFGFDGDGLCSGLNESGEPGFAAPPAGCPFGETGYEGPNTSFSGYIHPDPEQDANEGTVNFLGGTVKPGQGAYFSLESPPIVNCAETACEPTGLATELSGGAQTGPSITISDETPATDKATLSGENAAIATGKVAYKLYSDNECKNLVTEAGEVSVSGAAVPASHPQTLSPGTYYWQATYSGDSHNGASQSVCGSEVETVESAVKCSSAIGSGHFGSGAERQTIDNSLNTNLSEHEVIGFDWNGNAAKMRLTHLSSATCVIEKGEKRFSGKGEAVESKPKKRKGTYEVSFSIAIAPNGQTLLTIILEKENVVVDEFLNEVLTRDKEHIT